MENNDLNVKADDVLKDHPKKEKFITLMDIPCVVFIFVFLYRTCQYWVTQQLSCWCGISTYEGIEFACCPGTKYLDKFTTFDAVLLVLAALFVIFLLIMIILKQNRKRSIIYLIVIVLLCPLLLYNISQYTGYICNITGAACSQPKS